MRALLDLVMPARCAGCGDPAGPGCPRCLRALAGPARWTRPDPAPAGLPPVATVARYDGAVRGLLIGYKERGVAGLARPLGAALGRSLALALPPTFGVAGVVVVPIPSSRHQCRRRGGDVVAEVAARAVRELRRLGARLELVRGLRHIRPVEDSAGLDARARAANSAGAVGLRRGARAALAGRTVVLVDDLVTTGSSLAEAARVLRGASADVVAAATIAATSRREHPRHAGLPGIRSPAAQPRGWGLRC